MAPIGKPRRVVRRPIPQVHPEVTPKRDPEEPIFVPKEDPLPAPDWITAPAKPIPVELPQKA